MKSFKNHECLVVQNILKRPHETMFKWSRWCYRANVLNTNRPWADERKERAGKGVFWQWDDINSLTNVTTACWRWMPDNAVVYTVIVHVCLRHVCFHTCQAVFISRLRFYVFSCIQVVSGILASVDGKKLVTGKSWKCTTSSIAGWMSTSFDDRSWPDAVIAGTNTASDIHGNLPMIDSSATWIWTENFAEPTIDNTVYCRGYLGKHRAQLKSSHWGHRLPIYW